MEISVIEIAEILYKLQVGREVIQGHYPDNTADFNEMFIVGMAPNKALRLWPILLSNG